MFVQWDDRYIWPEQKSSIHSLLKNPTMCIHNRKKKSWNTCSGTNVKISHSQRERQQRSSCCFSREREGGEGLCRTTCNQPYITQNSCQSRRDLFRDSNGSLFCNWPPRDDWVVYRFTFAELSRCHQSLMWTAWTSIKKDTEIAKCLDVLRL